MYHRYQNAMEEHRRQPAMTTTQPDARTPPRGDTTPHAAAGLGDREGQRGLVLLHLVEVRLQLDHRRVLLLELVVQLLQAFDLAFRSLRGQA